MKTCATESIPWARQARALLLPLLLLAMAPAQAVLATLQVEGSVRLNEDYEPWSLSGGGERHRYLLQLQFDTEAMDTRPDDPTLGLYPSSLQSMQLSFDGRPAAAALLVPKSSVQIWLVRENDAGPVVSQLVHFAFDVLVPGVGPASHLMVRLWDFEGPSSGGAWALADDSLIGFAAADMSDFKGGVEWSLFQPGTWIWSSSTIDRLSMTLADPQDPSDPDPAAVPEPGPLPLLALGLAASWAVRRRRQA